MRCHVTKELVGSKEERVRIGGELVFDCRHKLDQLVGPHIDSGLPLTIDLRDALFVDSVLLMMFLRLQADRSKNSMRLIVREGSEVHRTLGRFRFESLISIDVVA